MPVVTNAGEQYLLNNAVGSQTLSIGLYNTSDSLGETDSTGAITTEPGNTNYSRAPTTFSVGTSSGSAIVSSDTTVSFDFSDLGSSTDVDGYFITDGSGTLIAAGDLQQVRTIGGSTGIQQIDVPSGGPAITLE